ncbi:5-(carboxyamino)imidazole ribonucleotide synthase [Stieleria varia]|uniref:N5-carboxyaminoimidazole ribonucleotide synthase n=1 Tax=Stieleria varia TaxID=2528005 RepID=A0A5C6A582_9BACT|nr:5-(carboxyamino)imidazole ribonucleotide synthase [Stieleria varia]TWT94586.1 N5-carboxyaminoimidazole ribonucleotide synthase [Stieleria varia]
MDSEKHLTQDAMETMEPPSVDRPVILPPATIGMVGGGQLGRMFAHAAMTMGYDVVVFCHSDDEPAAQVTRRVVCGALDDHDAVQRFAQQCDVITLEFENIPAETIRLCGQFAPTYPSHSVLATAQHRIIEKSTLSEAGLPVTPFVAVHDTESLIAAANRFAWPIIVKTAQSGYDGKGQHRVDGPQSAAEVPWSTADSWIAEQCISFDREISVVVARRADGVTKCFPPMENVHSNHILDVTVAPAAIDGSLRERAEQIASAAAETLGVVGLLCVELFVMDPDRIFINEVAPRPHNSGHLTIEAFATSQFQQHVRAVCGLPLGSTEQIVGGAAMVNLLGDLWNEDGSAPDWSAALDVAAVHLHLYGKRVAKVGRKMGHLTATAATPQLAVERAKAAREALTSVGSA